MIALYLLVGYVAFSALLWAATWVVFLADCATRWAAPVLYGTPAKLAKHVNALAVVMSTALNWLVFTAILLEFPREAALSTRLVRHKRQGRGWRQRLAARLGDTWLDPFDPTGHHI